MIVSEMDVLKGIEGPDPRQTKLSQVQILNRLQGFRGA